MKGKIPVGIIGAGMVGGTLKRWFEERMRYERGKDLFVYDTDPTKGLYDDISKAQVIFVTVPTPPNSDRSCNTSIVESVVRGIGGEKVVVIKSTVPPSTTERLQALYPQHKFLFNPEFLTEKFAWENMISPDRQIVGFTEKSEEAAYMVLSLLPKAPFMSPWGVGTYNHTRITATEAEIIKLGGNCYFTFKVSFANILAQVCETLGVNYENVRQGLSADYRIGDSHLDVDHGNYRGFGGYCFPKDLSSFIAFVKSCGLDDAHALLLANHLFNVKLLENQGLTLEEVSTHDHLLEKKLNKH